MPRKPVRNTMLEEKLSTVSLKNIKTKRDPKPEPVSVSLPNPKPEPVQSPLLKSKPSPPTLAVSLQTLAIPKQAPESHTRYLPRKPRRFFRSALPELLESKPFIESKSLTDVTPGGNPSAEVSSQVPPEEQTPVLPEIVLMATPEPVIEESVPDLTLDVPDSLETPAVLEIPRRLDIGTSSIIDRVHDARARLVCTMDAERKRREGLAAELASLDAQIALNESALHQMDEILVADAMIVDMYSSLGPEWLELAKKPGVHARKVVSDPLLHFGVKDVESYFRANPNTNLTAGEVAENTPVAKRAAARKAAPTCMNYLASRGVLQRVSVGVYRLAIPQ